MKSFVVQAGGPSEGSGIGRNAETCPGRYPGQNLHGEFVSRKTPDEKPSERCHSPDDQKEKGQALTGEPPFGGSRVSFRRKNTFLREVFVLPKSRA